MTNKEYSLETISRALADTIRAGVSKSPFYAYVGPIEVGELPAVVVEPLMANFTSAMDRGNDVYEFIVYVLVSRGDLPTAGRELSTLLSGNGPDSIRRAVFDNPKLGLEGNVIALVHTLAAYGGMAKWFKIEHIGAQLLVRVHIN